MFADVVEEDKARYGTQHPEFVASAKDELLFALEALETNVMFRHRYEAFVKPMVYTTEPHDFDTCFTSFKDLAAKLLG